ncbi:MAG TPA: sigma-54 dependent transcriptional regulator [Planctomycetaceae bacterium]|nr:sigma-54 dependent transcriptional regulator [Planctomycetaceae bacterium]HRA87516.1 sigma-54 dependent transcriptional regulator [Planctomycetaceae bacterium]
MTKLLVIDDEKLILECIRFAFPQPKYELITATNATDGLKLFQSESPDVVLSDIRLPDMSGLELFQQMHQADARVPVILMTGQGTSGTAIHAMQAGVFEYIVKPFNPETLIPLVESAAETSRLMRTPAMLPSDTSAPATGDMLIGNCAAMQEVYRAIGRVASQNVTVLILGESGTGKEVIARAIYNYSQRSKQPFLAINCAAIPENLLESEMFGHEKGSFSGAERKRIGKFEQCSGGTLFLDEIGDMTSLMQTKILRVLQDQSFERVGGNETIRTDVRLMAATNRNLEEMIRKGEFRGDLFYRLNVYTITLPPLRERGDDVALLAEHYCRLFAKDLGKELSGIAAETIQVLKNYDWPGNVRELQSVIKHALLEATGPVLVPAFLPGSVISGRKKVSHEEADDDEALMPSSLLKSVTSNPHIDMVHLHSPAYWSQFVADRLQSGSQLVYDEALQQMERQVIPLVLQHTDGNQLRAAKLLGVSRATLRTKCRQYGITVDRVVESGQ